MAHSAEWYVKVEWYARRIGREVKKRERTSSNSRTGGPVARESGQPTSEKAEQP